MGLSADAVSCRRRMCGRTRRASEDVMAVVTLNINGRQQSVEVDPATPLLWVLRDTLGMTGTKFGCGIGQCGACTILLDGQAVRACQTPAAAVGSKRATTIEG